METRAPATGPLASESQVRYLVGLRDGKDLSSLNPEQIAWLRDADFSSIPKTRASNVITQLAALPWMGRDAAHDPEVPDGRYAIPKTAGQIGHSAPSDPVGPLMFYSVKQGKNVTFVDVWASDSRWPVKSSEERNRILTAIKNDPDAGPRFGREIGRCYVCGRTLTDATSRSLGIGPVCRGDE